MLRIRSRLWMQIAAVLTLNLGVLLLLGLALWLQQTNSGIDSFLYAPARERVRDLGRMVEDAFPDMPDSRKTAWLEETGKPWNIRLVVYEDTGRLAAGPVIEMPPEVSREITRTGRQGRGAPRMFLVKAQQTGDYWIGYHFPLVVREGRPPVRHTLAVVTTSLLTNSFFFDWTPWVGGALAALLVTAVCWFPLVRRVTRSLQAIGAASADIAQGRFDVDIPIRGNDELADLSQSVSRMAAQLSRLVHGQRRFLADVAHELCAPLARMQLSAGILEQTVPEDSRTAVERLERDVSHMSALVGDLLSFTRGNLRPPRLESVNLADIVRSAVAQESVPDVEVLSEVATGTGVIGDGEFLTRAVANVLRNAIRYAGDAGPVTVTAVREEQVVRLEVADCGPGLAEAELESVFEPFYRPDTVRTPGTGGAGLGLAIVRSCVEACGGSVTCRNREPRGLAVTIVLRRA